MSRVTTIFTFLALCSTAGAAFGQGNPASLTANTPFASMLGGGTQELQLDAGATWSNRPYLVLGSFSGVAPGLSLGAGLDLALNPDGYMVLTVQAANSPALEDTLGSLAADGTAQARIHVPAGLPAMELHHAYVLFGSHNKVAFVSNSVSLSVI